MSDDAKHNIDRIQALPPLKEIIAAHGLNAKKSLGQNFLLDINITDKIVRLSGDMDNMHVIEIGAGPGGLTRSLLKTNLAKLTAIERDNRAISALNGLQDASAGRLEIIEADAMKIDLLSISSAPRAIIANLPYNIATPLLLLWLRQIREDHKAFEFMSLMFQKEVAARICAKPSSKSYGRLSVISQWLCDVRILFDLPPSAFTPPPKVKSAIVKFIPKKIDKNSPSFVQMEKVTSAAFSQRRKMVRSSLKDYACYFKELGISPESRAENLGVEDYISLAKIAAKNCRQKL